MNTPMDPLALAELDIENLAARLSENPRSPLFARLADLYLSRQRVREAVALCENGITLYPSYAGGHIVLGKCYQQLGEFTKARLSYQRALVLSPYNSVLHRLLVALPESVDNVPAESDAILAGPVSLPVMPEPEAAPVPAAVNADPMMSPVPAAVYADPMMLPAPAAVMSESEAAPAPAAVNDDPMMLPAPVPTPPEAAGVDTPPPVQEPLTTIYEPIPPPTVPPGPDEMAPSFDPFPTFEQYIDLHPTMEPTMTLEEYLKGRSSSPLSEPSTDFESLAKKLQNAKRIVPADTSVEQASLVNETGSTPQAIVSPTMAEIYVSQNEFDAALSAYEALIIRHPAQAVLFSKRIEEIKELQRNNR